MNNLKISNGNAHHLGVSFVDAQHSAINIAVLAPNAQAVFFCVFDAADVEVARKLNVFGHFPAHQPEALQLNAQDIGRSFDRKLLCGWNFTLALVALVGGITFQSFSTEIMVQIVC